MFEVVMVWTDHFESFRSCVIEMILKEMLKFGLFFFIFSLKKSIFCPSENNTIIQPSFYPNFLIEHNFT